MMVLEEQKIKDREYRRRYYEKKIAEDPEYFRKKNREWRRKNRDKANEYRRKWLETHPKVVTKSYTKWRKENPAKFHCKMYALRYGKLKESCEQCGAKEKLERHHPDYSRPLHFQTLCKDCHEALHAKLVAQGIDLNVDISVFANHHCGTCKKAYPECGRGHPSYRGRPCSLWEQKQSEGKK